MKPLICCALLLAFLLILINGSATAQSKSSFSLEVGLNRSDSYVRHETNNPTHFRASSGSQIDGAAGFEFGYQATSRTALAAGFRYVDRHTTLHHTFYYPPHFNISATYSLQYSSYQVPLTASWKIHRNMLFHPRLVMGMTVGLDKIYDIDLGYAGSLRPGSFLAFQADVLYPKHIPAHFSAGIAAGLRLNFTRHWGMLLLFHQNLTSSYRFRYHTRLEYFDPDRKQYPIDYPDWQTEGRGTITPYHRYWLLALTYTFRGKKSAVPADYSPAPTNPAP